MAWEENSRICLHMQLIAILSRIGVWYVQYDVKEWRCVVVEWLGKDFALDILAMLPLYGHFDCIFCCIIHRQVSWGWGDLRSPHPFTVYSLCLLCSLFSKRLEHLGDALFLLLHVRVNIEIKGCRDIGMTEQYTYCLIVTVAFNATCRKAMA